jgi:hypothetical protein
MGDDQKYQKATIPKRQFAAASICAAGNMDHAFVYRGSVDARIRVQNTLYLVFGA